MKIINSTIRTSNNALNMTPVSELNDTTELRDDSLIHIIQYIQENQYNSQKLKVSILKQKIYESVNNTFKLNYDKTHSHLEPPENSIFKDMVTYLSNKDKLKNDDDTNLVPPTEIDPNGFVKHINYDFEILRRYIISTHQDFNDELSNIYKRINGLDCYFNTSMTLTTTKKNTNGDITTIENISLFTNNITENNDYCQMSIKDGDKISDEWTCPADGNLVVVGWLDSSTALNNKAIPSSFCVIEGKINQNWEVISVQPVIPAKTMTYVGFNLLVHKNLVIRARTGFTVGAKSGQYSNEQDGYDTLSNSTPNGFKCQIFSNASYQRVDDLTTSEEG